jgi:hypothetical protein
MPQGFDIEAAKKSGYTDDEILSHLTRTRKFDIEGAVREGHDKAAIIRHLSMQPGGPPLPPEDIGAGMTGLRPPLPPGVTSRFFSSLAETALPSTTLADYAYPFLHPIEAIKNLPSVAGAILEAQGAEATTAGEAFKAGEYGKAALHGLGYTVPLFGPPLARAGEQMREGDIAGGLGTTMGVAGQLFGPKAVSKGVRAVPSVARRIAQESLYGTSVRAAMLERAKIETLNSEVLKNFAEKSAAHVEKSRGVFGKNIEVQRAYRQKVGEIQQQNAAELAEHQQTVKTLTEFNEMRQAQTAERRNLVNDITENGETLAMRLKDTEKQVRSQGNALFEEVAVAVEGQAADPVPIRAAVQHAKRNILRGSEESNKIFDSILADTRPPEPTAIATSLGKIEPTHPLYRTLMDQGVIDVPKMEPITFRDLQGYYSELGQKASGGNLPGDVYHALKYVKESGIGSEMTRMAEAGGVADKLGGARQFWREFQNAFHDMRAVARGGSPLARAFRAIDPDYAVDPFLGKAGLRGIELLRRYDPAGAAVAAQTVAKFRHVRTLPKTFEAKPIPLPPEPKGPGPIPRPKPLPVAPPRPDLAVFDPHEFKVKAVERIAQRIRGDGGWWLHADVGAVLGGAGGLLSGHPYYAAGLIAYPVGRRLLGKALLRPSVVEWLSKPTSKELGIKPPVPPAPPLLQRLAEPVKVVQPIAGRLEERSTTKEMVSRASEELRQELGRNPKLHELQRRVNQFRREAAP